MWVNKEKGSFMVIMAKTDLVAMELYLNHLATDALHSLFEATRDVASLSFFFGRKTGKVQNWKYLIKSFFPFGQFESR